MKKIILLACLFGCSLSFATSEKNDTAPVNCHQQNYCWDYMDCAPGEYCSNRGDGIKLCFGQGKGKQNDFCTTEHDCEQKSCKDRGDGLRVCMGVRE